MAQRKETFYTEKRNFLYSRTNVINNSWRKATFYTVKKF